MKTTHKFTVMAVLIWAAMQTPIKLNAETTEIPVNPETVTQAAPEVVPAKTNPHLKLCEMLGLRVGLTYEFMIEGNSDVHYWTIRSLGGRGWIFVKDSRYPATWVNLSRIVAVSPVNARFTPERPKKPNRQ